MTQNTYSMDEISKRKERFQQLKHQCLSKDDLSRKGSIDEPIRGLVDTLNKHQLYYTTSTCSGRISLTEKPYGRSGIKKGNIFHLNSHEAISFVTFDAAVQEAITACESERGAGDDAMCIWLKFEPFIMHVQCYDLEAARLLLNIALAAGCRNSGITLGKPDKFMVAVRSTSSMEVPIYCGSRFELSSRYMEFLQNECNQRFSENSTRLNKLSSTIGAELSCSPDSSEARSP